MNQVLTKKALDIFNQCRKSENDILYNGVFWKEGLQFQRWDWRQGVGLYGLYHYAKNNNNQEIIDYLKSYLQRRIEEGQPAVKHINTVCPMLTYIHLYEHELNEEHLNRINEWVDWIMNVLPRTQENGLSHYCGPQSPNTEQLWDDTLFMTVLFLGKAGMVLNRRELVDYAYEQFLIHEKHLKDVNTNLWYHAYCFIGDTHYSKALWGRGNCWITASIPLFIDMVSLSEEQKTNLVRILKEQLTSLENYIDESGLYHTLLDDPTTYLETTGSAGIAFGALKACNMGLIEDKFLVNAKKTAEAVFDKVVDGILTEASDGTPLGLTLDFYKNVAKNTRGYAQGLSLMAITEYLKLK